MNCKTIIVLVLSFLCPALFYGQSDFIRRVAVLNIIDKASDFTAGQKIVIVNKLSSAVSNLRGYECYERIDVSSIMSEQEFQRTGLVKDSQIKQIGEMVGADCILVSEAAKLDDKKLIISAKIIDVESAKIENASNVITTLDLEDMKAKCSELADKLFNITRDDGQIFVIAEYAPTFQGGNVNKFLSWLRNNMVYPVIASENGVEGTVMARFIIEPSGLLDNIEIIKSPDNDLSKEVVRLLSLSPKWEPGRQRDVPVRVRYTIPVVFKLN